MDISRILGVWMLSVGLMIHEKLSCLGSNCLKTSDNLMYFQRKPSRLNMYCIAQEHHWSLPLSLVSSYLAVNQCEDISLPQLTASGCIVQFPLFPRLAMHLDPSSPPPTHHNWLSVEVGGWENQTPQIVLHST